MLTVRPLNLSQVCHKVISNGEQGGVDEVVVDDLQEWFSRHHGPFVPDLLNGVYYPKAVRAVKIPKPKGGYRQSAIPTVRDRLVQ
mgnify:CR=1 FL=1